MPHLTQSTLLALLLSLLLPSSAGIAAAPSNGITDIDRIVVVVNDDVITQSELSRRLHETKKQLEMEKISVPPDATLKKQLLERMVLERLQIQLATSTGIRVTPPDIDRAFDSVAQRNKYSTDEFRKALSQKGIDVEAYRNQLRDQITIQQLLEREINNRIVVTDTEVNNFLGNSQNRSGMDLSYHLSQILIGISESATPETIQAARMRAEEISKKLSAGANFEEMAVSYSQGADALKGGDLGWKKAGELPELFLKALKNLRHGEVSEVFRSPIGFHILKLNDKRGEQQSDAVMQTHARHILLRPSEILSSDDAKQKLLNLRERIENGADFAALARAHSDDSGSAASGGDLGWSNPGQMVPEFEKAMNSLKVNELSQPVKTGYGYHLIQVLERRSHDVTQERVFTAARQQIHARKADERYEQWARQLRSEAYVEYHFEDVN